MLAAAETLAGGEMRLLGRLPRASNAAFLAELAGGVLAVYKPRRGEAPLWDFPAGTLCNREVAAYLLAEALGWPAIPPTILREGPYGEGAVQAYVQHDPREHYFTLRDARQEELRAFAAFDVVANNADRKSGHCLLGEDGTIWGVDHGVCFAAEPKLRTVVWDFAGEPVPPAILEDLERVRVELEGALAERLGELLSEDEVAATHGRALRLLETGRFPEPGPERSYPWPPV